MPEYFTKLLCHCNGTDGQKSMVDSSYYNRSSTFYGDAQLDVDQKVFGTASLLFDGVGDYVSYPDSADWVFGTGAFTIDFRIRWNGTPGSTGIMGQSDGSGNNLKWAIYWNAIVAGNLTLHFQNPAGTSYNVNWAWSPAGNTWYHVAVVRSGNSWYLFVNGNLVSTQTQSAAVPDVTDPLNLGACGELWQYFKGWLDEIRISKGIARWTANFTPPTEEYEYTNWEACVTITAAVSTTLAALTREIRKLFGIVQAQTTITAFLKAVAVIAGTWPGQATVAAALRRLKGIATSIAQTCSAVATLTGRVFGLSDYAELKLLEHTVGKASFSLPTVYLGLCNTDPTDAGTGANCGEVPNTGGYARVATAGKWGAAADGQISNTGAITFPVATTNWGTVAYFALFTSGTYGQGDMLVHDVLDKSKLVLAGDSVEFAAGALSVSLS